MMQQERSSDQPRDLSVSTYYDETTEQFVKVSGDLRMVHYGLWGSETKTEEESLLRSIHALAEGLELGPGKRILDSGCGLGGGAVVMAREYGVRVTGLTISRQQVVAATEFAKQKGVAGMVDFRQGDFMDMPFPDESFDAVTNHESFCYATDKLSYLDGVHRVLRPGGRLAMMEGALTGAAMSETQEAIHVGMQKGWHMPALESFDSILATMEKAGFENIRTRDLKSEVMPSAESLSRRWRLLVLLTPPPKLKEIPVHKFLQAAVDFDLGLKQGFAAYYRLQGTKPDTGAPSE
ncbi:MAG: methyltransferase domain-containing protein [Gammaproteobacteria bacterium]|nr:methyltransferase domain-containing protein [Gammaproteobacteria bacterium]